MCEGSENSVIVGELGAATGRLMVLLLTERRRKIVVNHSNRMSWREKFKVDRSLEQHNKICVLDTWPNNWKKTLQNNRRKIEAEYLISHMENQCALTVGLHRNVDVKTLKRIVKNVKNVKKSDNNFLTNVSRR